MIQGDGTENALCVVKDHRIVGSVVLYPNELEVDLVSATLAAVVLVAAASALLSHAAVRHNWRLIQFATMPMSFFGALIGVVDPTSPLLLLSTLYPLKGLIDPSLDINSMCRAASKGMMRALLPFLQALAHHAGTAVLVAKIHFLATTQPFVAFLCVPLPLLGIVLLEFMSWLIEAQILMRTANTYSAYANYVVVLFQVFLAVFYRLSVTSSGSVSFGLALVLIATGNLLFLVCAALGYKKSTHEYFEDNESADLPEVVRQASVARNLHKVATQKMMLSSTSRRWKRSAQQHLHASTGPVTQNNKTCDADTESELYAEPSLPV